MINRNYLRRIISFKKIHQKELEVNLCTLYWVQRQKCLFTRIKNNNIFHSVIIKDFILKYFTFFPPLYILIYKSLTNVEKYLCKTKEVKFKCGIAMYFCCSIIPREI